MRTCETYRRDMLRADTGELAAPAAEALARHARACPECRAFRDAAERLMALARENLPAGEPGAAALAAVRRAARAAPPRTVRFPQPVLPVLAYAALLTILVGAWFAFVPRREAPSAAGDLAVLLSMVADEEAEHAPVPPDADDAEQLRALAHRLLSMEGLADDESADWAEPTADAGFPPTTLRWRSSGVSVAEAGV